MDVIRVADVPEASFDYYYSDEASDHEVRHEHADSLGIDDGRRGIRHQLDTIAWRCCHGS